jgi:hypothetical protein
MGDLIHRIGRVLFEGARPIDRTVLIVDALVLLIIFVEWIQAQRREHRISQRQELVDARQPDTHHGKPRSLSLRKLLAEQITFLHCPQPVLKTMGYKPEKLLRQLSRQA